jgi:hypothetical protein
LQNFRARFYDDDLFRFYAMDPAGQQTSPYAFSGNSPLIYRDKDGKEFFTALLVSSALGAWIGGASYTASAAFSPGGFNNWSLGGLGKALGMGAISGAAGMGVGGAFGAVGSNGITGELARAYAHGLSNVGVNMAFGNKPSFSSFASSAAGSLVGSTITTAGGGDLAQIAGSSLVGGTTAAATGGDFWSGAAMSATVGLLNHAAHSGDDEPKISMHEDGRYYDSNGYEYELMNGRFVPIISPLDLMGIADIRSAYLGFRDLARAILGIKAAKASTTLLSQYNSAESLIQGAGNLTKVKAGMQGFVKGDGPSIFNSITQGGTLSPKGYYTMANGTVISKYFSSTSGDFTIFINQGSNAFKIRIIP